MRILIFCIKIINFRIAWIEKTRYQKVLPTRRLTDNNLIQGCRKIVKDVGNYGVLNSTSLDVPIKLRFYEVSV